MKARMLAEFDKPKALILLKKKEQKLTNQAIAAMAGITRQTLDRMMTQRTTDDWKLGDLINICAALGVSQEAFYEAIDYQHERRNDD